ncbi:MAG: SoxR reducing system RseC family protein [Bacillota bacterium]
MKEIGTVISVKGDSVVVEVQKKAACRSCGRCGGHISFGGDVIIIEAIKTGDPGPGDLVELEIPDSDYLRLSLLVYGLPLVCAGAGYGGGWFLGRLLGSPSTWGWIFALGGFALSFVWLRSYDTAATQARRYMPIARPVQED